MQVATSDPVVAQFNASMSHNIERLDRRFFDGPPTYIFNLFDREHPFYASYGTRIVPACPQGKEYSDPLVIPHFVSDFVQKTGDEGGLLEKAIPGEDVVAEILRMLADAQNTPVSEWGVFASKNSTPTKHEIKAARERLVRTLQRIVDEGNKMYSGSAAQRDEVGSRHRAAARYLNLEPAWMLTDVVMDRCDGCNVPVAAGVAFCTNGCVVDETKARKIKPWLFTGQPVAA